MIRSPAGFDGGDRIKRYLDYYQPSYGVMMLSAGQFSPALLFAAGEQGAWYDPSDFLPNWRLNLLTWSESFDNAAWTKGSLVTTGMANVTATTDPLGGNTADKLQETATTAEHYVLQGVTVAAAQHTFSVYLKAAERTWATIYFSTGSATPTWFNLAADGTGVPGTVASGFTAASTYVGNGWYRCSITGTSTAATWYAIVNPSLGNGVSISYAGTLNSGIYIWGADLRLTSNASVSPTYQKITDGIQDYLTYQPQPVMFQDSAGTTPVTAVEQPVGLLLDKSKGLALGAEIISVAADRDFSSNTGYWSFNGGVGISGGTMNWSATADAYAGYTTSNSITTPGKYYEITWTLSSVSSGGIKAGVGNQFGVARTTTGTYTDRVLAGSASNRIGFFCVGTTTASIDNVSVKEVSGNHASQSTAASRPVLSARVNLLTYSEQFDNAAWTKAQSTVSANTTATTDPLGGNTADKIIEAATTTTHFVYNTSVFAASSGVAYTLSAYAKAGERDWLALFFSTGGNAGAYFNLATGVVGTVSSGYSATITNAGNGWYRCAVTLTPVSSGSFYALIGPASADNTVSYAGDITKGIYLWGADLRVTNVGVGLPAYQRIAAATDYDTSGFPLYLKFDGVDDSLATGTIDPGSVDKAQVFAGVRKLSDAGGLNIIAEFGPVVDSTVGTFAIGNSIGNASRWLSALRGSAALVYYEPATYAAPITNIVTSLFDIAGAGISTEILPRVNGVLVQTNPNGASTGSGNFSAQSLSIGQRSSTASLRYNGNVYSMILRFSAANLSDAQIASTETWVNGKTMAY